MTGILPTHEPRCIEGESHSIELTIDARPRDLGGFSVRRSLPAPKRRLVGPFIFFDHLGPAELPPGDGVNVRPHPHIALATVTYLFEGEIVHRDSLGSLQNIRPGDVNWMLAGHGIVHSERSTPEVRQHGQRIHGIQSWVALPTELEEAEPRFEHHPAASLPKLRRAGVVLDVIAGSAYGARSPVGVLSPTLYVHALLEREASLPLEEGHEERAAYVVEGSLCCEGITYAPGTLVVFRAGASVLLQADERTRLMLIGGAKLQGERFVYWNFVSSSEQRIERAKDDWRARRFPSVAGDDEEFIPLPEL